MSSTPKMRVRVGVLALALTLTSLALVLRQRQARGWWARVPCLGGTGDMGKWIGDRTKARVEGVVGTALKRIAKALGNRHLERQGVKLQLDAKVRTAAANVEEGVKTMRTRVAEVLRTASEHLRP